jgi:hypothetical protein
MSACKALRVVGGGIAVEHTVHVRIQVLNHNIHMYISHISVSYAVLVFVCYDIVIIVMSSPGSAADDERAC